MSVCASFSRVLRDLRIFVFLDVVTSANLVLLSRSRPKGRGKQGGDFLCPKQDEAGKK